MAALSRRPRPLPRRHRDTSICFRLPLRFRAKEQPLEPSEGCVFALQKAQQDQHQPQQAPDQLGIAGTNLAALDALNQTFDLNRIRRSAWLALFHNGDTLPVLPVASTTARRSLSRAKLYPLTTLVSCKQRRRPAHEVRSFFGRPCATLIKGR